jgi:nicotinamide-nucleotide amidase
MTSIILSNGDELMLGQTVDTNSAWLSQQLAAVGYDILAHMTVPDDQKAIERAIRDATGRCDVLLISGGIGPTEDDLTRQALAAVMGVELELNEQWLAQLQEFFKARGREMPQTNKIQAMIPRGATMIENTAGTAAGIDAVLPPLPLGEGWGEGVKAQSLTPALPPPASTREPRERGKCRVFVMPGVPKEMKTMFERSVLPHIREKSAGAVILSRTLHTFGLGESWVAEKLGTLMMRQQNPSVGTTVANGIVSLRVNARYESRERAQQELDHTIAACRARLGDIIFGEESQTLQEVIASALASSRKTVTAAESCTGGLLSKMLTDVPGSSEYFKQGWIVYSNQAKRERLGVTENLLNVYGAVSEPVVTAMATNARRLAKADFALAISGVAGPTGGTPAKPVGTVCIALADEQGISARTFNFAGDREMIRDRSAKMALTMLRFHLLGKPLPF